jgi:hypothetical protein
VAYSLIHTHTHTHSREHTNMNTHTHTHTHIFRRKFLCELSASRDAQHSLKTSIALAGFELALPGTRLPQTYALDRAATGIGDCAVTSLIVT